MVVGGNGDLFNLWWLDSNLKTSPLLLLSLFCKWDIKDMRKEQFFICFCLSFFRYIWGMIKIRCYYTNIVGLCCFCCKNLIFVAFNISIYYYVLF